MKTATVLLLIFMISTDIYAQGVNQITIIPANPTATDTIYVISDLTYFGNCTFGLVHHSAYLAGSNILIIPTYCGYFDTTLCNSVDTFRVGPYPAGNYAITIDYHQGSICPVSGFDATIFQADTTLLITTVTGLNFNSDKTGLDIFPNPASEYVTIRMDQQLVNRRIKIKDLLNRVLMEVKLENEDTKIDLTALKRKGIYLIEVFSDDNVFAEKLILN